MSNSDDPKFDDYQNPNEEQDLGMFLEEHVNDVENIVDDESVDLNFPDESLLGENTATFADELDMFADLNGDLTFPTDIVTDAEDVDDLPIDTEETAKNSLISAETDDLFLDVESVAEPEELMGLMDDPILAAAIEDIPVVEDKKAKKAREKAEKAQAIAQAKAAKLQAKVEKAQAKAQAKAEKGQAKVQVIVDDPTLAAAIEDVPVVEDKKAKKAREKAEKAQAIAQAKTAKALAKAEKQQAKSGKTPEEKPPKAKKEKKPKMPGDKQPGNVGALCFTASLVLMFSAFGGVNAYAIMKHGVGGAMVFLAIFDLLAASALVIPILLRRSKNAITDSDVSLGIAAISLIVGCMFVLANLAYNLFDTL